MKNTQKETEYLILIIRLDQLNTDLTFKMNTLHKAGKELHTFTNETYIPYIHYEIYKCF